MQFIIIARDAKDDGALSRRMAAREAHMEGVKAGIEAGQNLIAAAMLKEGGDMAGSVMIVEYPDRVALDEWLKNEPYVIGEVWQDIEIIECKIPPAFEQLLSKDSEAA